MGAILKVAPPEIALRRYEQQLCGGLAPWFLILWSTFYPNLKQIGWKMTELLNGRHFEGGATGKGAVPPRTASHRCGGVATSFPILRSTFYPNLKQIGWKMTGLLDGRHFEGGATRNGAAYGAVALWRRCSIIPHPTNSVLPEFEANW
jgi:hypothetical protein